MINRSFFLFFTAILLSWGINVDIASGSFSITHTQDTPGLKPASLSASDNSYQTASVCFMGIGCGGDAGFNKGDGSYETDSKLKCFNEGYIISSCAKPSYPSVICPYNNNYYLSCQTDRVRACQEEGYETNCNTGEILDVEQRCPYDSTYKKCKCNPCDGYDYTYAQAAARGYITDGTCNSCGTIKYKRKLNPCSGYQVCECGAELGASACYSGTTLKYNKCKNCCAYECSLSSCPAGNTCRYEACTNKYCITGCALNYTDMCELLAAYNCRDLGYSQQNCTGDTLYCLYDTSYKFCL